MIFIKSGAKIGKLERNQRKDQQTRIASSAAAAAAGAVSPETNKNICLLAVASCSR